MASIVACMFVSWDSGSDPTCAPGSLFPLDAVSRSVAPGASTHLIGVAGDGSSTALSLAEAGSSTYGGGVDGSIGFCGAGDSSVDGRTGDAVAVGDVRFVVPPAMSGCTLGGDGAMADGYTATERALCSDAISSLRTAS
eukprot:SAG31_NODE_1921_length_6916_cov_6.643245_3_plen_139_part_00